MPIHNLQFLSLELQTSVAELRQLGTPERAIELLVERIFKASELKTNSLQESVIRIEESINVRLDALGDKLIADVQSQSGATNEMLIEVRAAQMDAAPQLEEASRGIADIKKSWQQMNIWREQVDTWRGLLDRRMESLAGEVDQVKIEIDRRRPLFDLILQEIAAIKHENIQDELSRDERLRLTAGLRTILDRWGEVEALLDQKADN